MSETTPNGDATPLYPPLNTSTSIERVSNDQGTLPSDQFEKDKVEKKGIGVATAKDVNTGEAIEVEAMPLNEESFTSTSKPSTEQKTADNTSQKKDSFAEDAAEFAAGAAFSAGADFVADSMRNKKKKEDESEKQKEKSSSRSFLDIQTELISLVNNPDSQKEKELKRERAKIIREAKDVGVFETVKVHMEKVQSVESFNEAEKIIQRINIENVENEAEGLNGWNKNFEGMIGEYVNVAVLNMDLALAEAGGGNYPDDIARQNDILKLKREIDIRGWGIPPANLNRLARESLEENTNDKQTKVLEELRDLSARQALSQEQQTELMRRGYGGLIQILDSNAPMDPRTYKLNLPPWYDAETTEFKRMVDFMANANYIASVKRTCKGPSDVFELPLSLNTRDIERMWAELPGFKEATATMVSDIFDPNIKDRFVISGHPAKKEQKEIIGPPYKPYRRAESSTGGYAILESDTTILEYKDKLATKIGQVLDQRRVNLNDRFRGVSNKDHATAAVSTIFNTLYGGGAFDSGDELNKLNPGQPMAVTLGFRMLMMPGARGESKWLVDRDENSVERGVYEEDFGGPIGRHLRWNASHTPGYADKIRNGEVKYLPRRLLFSMFEHETFTSTEDGGRNRFAGKSLAEALLTVSEESRNERGVKVPRDRIGFDDIEKGGDMFTSYVANAASYVLPIYDHLTSNDPKKRLAGEQAINLVMKCRKDERLRKIFYGPQAEDMITAIAGLAASPDGFETGTDKLLLKIPEANYLAKVRKVLNDDRWFEGMPFGFKKRMISSLNVTELLSDAKEFIMEFLPFLFDTPLNPRQKIRAEIRRNTSRV